MTSDLTRLVAADAGAIADHVRHGLQAARAPHYRGMSESLLRRRCRRLVDAFVESTRGNPEPLVAHVRDIASERMAEGIALEEIELALTLLEGRAWLSVIERMGLPHLADDLQVVTRTIGLARKELARRYRDGKHRTSARTAAVAVPALFAGTDQGPDLGGTDR
jgi:hypothetical protein